MMSFRMKIINHWFFYGFDIVLAYLTSFKPGKSQEAIY